MNALRYNPVRLYAVVAAVVALVAHYVPDLPIVLILALAAAVLGVGEGVRARVTPEAKVAIRVAEARHFGARDALAEVRALAAPPAKKAAKKTPARKRA